MRIRRLIENSYRSASNALVMGTSPDALARARERAFSKSLIVAFQSEYRADDIRVFSQLARGNLRDFGGEALLSDIAIARAASGQTHGREAKPFFFVAALIWQIEIDFSREWRRSVHAINRLNCGAAENKLLIIARPARGLEDMLQTLRPPFSAGTGNAWLACIPHPSDWDDSEEAPRVWRLVDEQWSDAEA